MFENVCVVAKAALESRRWQQRGEPGPVLAGRWDHLACACTSLRPSLFSRLTGKTRKGNDFPAWACPALPCPFLRVWFGSLWNCLAAVLLVYVQITNQGQSRGVSRQFSHLVHDPM